MLTLRIIFLNIIIIMIFIEIGYSLRCRSEDGPSDGELKRVARSCMRKFGDVAFAQSSQQQQQQQQQRQHHQQSLGRYTSRQRLTNRENHGYNYENSEENDYDLDDDRNYNNRNYNRQHLSRNNNNDRSSGNGANNSGGQNDERSRDRNRYNSNNRTSNANGNINWNYSNQRNSANNGGNNNINNRNKNGNNNQNNSFSDVACIVHCFFAEMHMLNNDDYPDRHKMLYILTKDLRDRDLRNFYTDTIQECFRYLENQRRRDKCHFSRDLITCMSEYAKGNCDDWNEFNMVFN